MEPRPRQPKKSPSPVKAPSSGAPAPVRRPSFKHKAVNHYEKNKDLIRYRMMLEQHRIEGYQPKTAEMPKDFCKYEKGIAHACLTISLRMFITAAQSQYICV